MTQVYWIHLDEHNDINSQGYIGVSKNALNRFNVHLKHLKNNIHENIHLSRAYDKYKNILLTIIFEGSLEECYNLEHELRPYKDIGWNIAQGGGAPPINYGNEWNKGRVFSEEIIKKRADKHRESIKEKYGIINVSQLSHVRLKKSIKMKKRYFSDDHKNRISLNRKGKGTGSNNAMASEENRKKVSLSKIGRVALYKDGKRKMAKPGTTLFEDLQQQGYLLKHANV
mgnify:FL=1